MREWERERERERLWDGRDIYKSFSNEIYRHVFIRGKEKTKGRCHHHHNEQYGTNSTWLIAIHVRLPTELLAKLCQKSSECLDTIILSITGPETNIFMTSCTQADLASQFLVCNFLLRQHNFWLQQLKEFIFRSIKIKKTNKNRWIFVSCALIQILGGEGISYLSAVFILVAPESNQKNLLGSYWDSIILGMFICYEVIYISMYSTITEHRCSKILHLYTDQQAIMGMPTHV